MVAADGRIRIIDFGFAEAVSPNLPNTVRKGTPVYMAPELREGSYDGKKADLFALGVLLFLMNCRRYPFDLKEEEKLKYVVLPEEYKVFLYDNENYWKTVEGYLPNTPNKAKFKNLINKMLALKPEDRLTLEQIEMD